MSKERRLGRGLEALLSSVAAAQPVVETPTVSTTQASSTPERQGFSVVSDYNDGQTDQLLQEMMTGRPTNTLPIALIDQNPYQPRLDFDPKEMQELVDSLTRHGMIQPIVARQKGDRYELIAGERRLRAAVQAGWEEVPAHILVVEDREMAELALTENMQRKDLNPIEKAVAFQNYLDCYECTHEDLAKRLGLDRSTITNLLRLLDLPKELQQAVRQGVLSHSHARTLLPLEEGEQIECANRIMKEDWSVRQTEDFVKKILAGDTQVTGQPDSKHSLRRSGNDPQIRELEQQFRTTLGMKVSLCANDKGKGKLVIQFASSKEFERVYQLICPGKTDLSQDN